MDTIELNPSIHLTKVMMDWNRINGLNIISALQPIFTSSFPQPRGKRLFNRVFATAIFSWTSWPVFLASSLPCMCTLHTGFHKGIFHTMYLLHSTHTHTEARSPLLPRRDGGLEQTAGFVLETALPRRTLPQREERKSACAYAGYGMLLLCYKPSYDAEGRILCSFDDVLEFGVCLPALQA